MTFPFVLISKGVCNKTIGKKAFILIDYYLEGLRHSSVNPTQWDLSFSWHCLFRDLPTSSPVLVITLCNLLTQLHSQWSGYNKQQTKQIVTKL